MGFSLYLCTKERLTPTKRTKKKIKLRRLGLWR